MKVILYLIVVSSIVSCRTTAQSLEGCNRDSRLKSIANKLPKKFCIPKGYWVTQIIDTVDLTNDSRKDIVVKWRKKQSSEGDTLRVAIYGQSIDSTFFEVITLDNLYTPIFTDYTKEYKTGNLVLDSVYMKFIYSNYSLVEFKTNTIIVGFFTDAGGGVDFYFSYRDNLDDWLLERMVFWDKYNKSTRKEIKNERKAKKQISIREFRILDFLD